MTPALTLAAALVLADGPLVTLALPDLIHDLNTTVQGVAAVLAVFITVLAVALVPAGRIASRRAGTAGFALMAAASVVCAAAGSLPVLLAGRALQAVGGAGGLAAAFVLLQGAGAGRRRWIEAAVLGAAAAPAIGGVLTQVFDWHAIFVAQVPVALGGSVACSRLWVEGTDAPRVPDGQVAKQSRRMVGFTALALLSAALLSVLFLLVLLLVAGWAVSPIGAAAIVTVLPVSALAGARLRLGGAAVRATVGCVLVGGGVLALAWLPSARLAWTIPPQILAGLGMGLALRALIGELLVERSVFDAMLTLAIRHAGMAIVLIGLAPLVAHQLENSTERARERGVALVLDAKLQPLDKLRLAPALLTAVEARRPRAALNDAIASNRATFTGTELVTYDELAKRADDTLIAAVADAFRLSFLVGGALAFAAALVLAPLAIRAAAAIGLAFAVAIVLPAAYAAANSRLGPKPVPLGNPCAPRALPGAGGIGGFLQDRALELLDTTACRLHARREELVLALADNRDAQAFKRRHGVDPRSIPALLGALLS